MKLTTNELLIKYAQLNNVKGVLKCIEDGANPNYENELLLHLAVFFGNKKLLKVALTLCDCKTLVKQLEWAYKQPDRADVIRALEIKKSQLEAKFGLNYFT